MNQLTDYNNLLKSKRGFVTKIPTNKTAIMVISGGLDSVATSARLLIDYQLKLYPLFIKRGQTSQHAEFQAVKHYTKYFQKRFGKKHFADLFVLEIEIPPKKIKHNLKSLTTTTGYPVRNISIYLHAVQLAVSLSLQQKSNIKTIFCGALNNDLSIDNTLSCLRADTISVCENLNDWQWQISSPNSDPYISKKLYDKSSLIKWSNKHHLSLSETVSCCFANKSTNYQNCGKCKYCQQRIVAYQYSNVNDPTRYFQK